LQRGGGGVRNYLPLHAVEMRHLAADCPLRRFRARHVTGKPGIGHVRTRHELVGEKPVRARPDRLCALLERIGT
jgi:hypothetical protein